MPMDRLWVLVRSILVVLQLAVFSLALPIYGIVFLVAGLLNLIWVLATGASLGGIDMLFEPLKWSVHQSKVLVGASDDFRWAPFL